ncbi:HmuY family protein [Bacteroidota bacterium]
MFTGKIHIAGLITLIMLALCSCFEEDNRVDPHIPGDEETFVFEKSIYFNQSFFDLSNNEILAENENSAWVLRFASQTGDWHIGINSSNYWGVFKSRTADLDSVPDRPATEEWIFDKSTGESDSTAMAGWVKFSDGDTLYSDHIYLLGVYDGIGYKANWAIQFKAVDETSYQFRLMSWPSGTWTDYTIPKDPFYNYQYFTTSDGGKVLQIEPQRDLWDLRFTQYGSILYTDDGIPTPYYVRGVLLNRNGVTAAIDSVNSFADITFENLPEYSFSLIEDVIGYEWKDVEIDMNTNTAVYTVNPDITYIIWDTEGFYFKLRFISYYNDQGEKGFPVFEHVRL